MINPFKRIKVSVKDWLDRLAQENQKEYGGDVPDCCRMNSQISKGRIRK